MEDKLFAILWFWLVSILMGYAYFRPEWAISLVTRLYGLLGINLSFRERGRGLVRMVSAGLAILFLMASYFVYID